MAAEEDAPRDAPATWADAVAPDDISSLSRDIAAYHRELRRARRQRRIQHLLHRRNTLPLLVLTAATVLAGLVAVLLAVMAPRTLEHAPKAAPLAAPRIADGLVGGLLPDVTLTGPNGRVAARDATLRPAVFALVPSDCACATLLNSLAGEAFSEELPLALVVPEAGDPRMAGIVRSLTRGSPGLYFDPAASLAAAVAAQGVTLVAIDRDGTIYDIQRSVTSTTNTSLVAKLQTMVLRSKS
jgi:hypothetical protein